MPIPKFPNFVSEIPTQRVKGFDLEQLPTPFYPLMSHYFPFPDPTYGNLVFPQSNASKWFWVAQC